MKKIKELYYYITSTVTKARRFVTNAWKFRNVLWKMHTRDYMGSIMLLKKSLELLEEELSTSYEVKESLDKKLRKLRDAIEILNNIENDAYLEKAESILGECKLGNWEFVPIPGSTNFELIDDLTEEEHTHNRKVFDKERELEQKDWKKLMKIIDGQDFKEFERKAKRYPDVDREKMYDEWFDGSGLKSWWK